LAYDIERLIAALEPTIRNAFLSAVADLRSEAQIAVIVSALDEGRVDDAIKALNLGPEFFAPLDDALRAAYLMGGRDAIAGLPAIADPFPQGAWCFALMARMLKRRIG